MLRVPRLSGVEPVFNDGNAMLVVDRCWFRGQPGDDWLDFSVLFTLNFVRPSGATDCARLPPDE
jgi:hypothetical protein